MYAWDEEAKPKSYLRLRDTGDGEWAIVRVEGWQRFGKEVVARGLTRKQAEQMIALAKEE